MGSPESLEAWLSRLIAVPSERIELGLARVEAAYERLGRPRPAPIVLTVGGTNGKGSTVAFLVAMLRASGYRVGSYTSPHLFRFNERMVIDGVEASDEAITDAFRRVDAARGDIALTFFEFATLAALQWFSDAALDVVVLEVGLGGRLDAVNLIDADVAIVTTIDLDHQQYLGDTREAIAVEKAGIFRAGRPAVVAEAAPPASLLAEIARIGAHPLRLGHEYRIDIDRDDWHWIGAGTSLRLPPPGLRAPVQHYNAAAAIAALMALRDRLHVPFRALRIGLTEANVRGRLEVFPGAVETVVDVGHNPQAAQVLADWLRRHPRRTRAVFSALADKDLAGIIEPLLPRVAHWHLCGLDAVSPRGLDVRRVHARVGELIGADRCSLHADPEAALASAHSASQQGERVLAFGSFLLVSALGPTLNRMSAPAN
ncbi:MAG TPA: folylpolyglutamate synthase/dihydrofolate synthase family protein [Pseudomonadota bacterium]|jgi:dihydrofolate synthase/folylpolyglutamate synthase|nr:folylpolyglutamate synthase/dihydrofolate synthase family protein [Pseudomonadota bacterium]